MNLHSISCKNECLPLVFAVMLLCIFKCLHFREQECSNNSIIIILLSNIKFNKSNTTIVITIQSTSRTDHTSSNKMNRQDLFKDKLIQIQDIEKHKDLREMRHFYKQFTLNGILLSEPFNEILEDLNIDNCDLKFKVFLRNGLLVYEKDNDSKANAFCQAVGLLPPCEPPDDDPDCKTCLMQGKESILKVKAMKVLEQLHCHMLTQQLKKSDTLC